MDGALPIPEVKVFVRTFVEELQKAVYELRLQGLQVLMPDEIQFDGFVIAIDGTNALETTSTGPSGTTTETRQPSTDLEIRSSSGSETGSQTESGREQDTTTNTYDPLS